MLQRGETKFPFDALDRGRCRTSPLGGRRQTREINMAVQSNDHLFQSQNQYGMVSSLMSGLEYVFGWFTRSNERQMMANLDERTLRDIGISKADVYREALKPFWRS